MDEFLKAGKRSLPTAIFAANDIIGIGVMRAMLRHGIKLPDDVSIIGMDDLSICTLVTPELSSVHVPKNLMGRAAVHLLLNESSGVLKTFVDIFPVKRASIREISK
jgi:DNA-binding LacI/PurR family transcriptional regulator